MTNFAIAIDGSKASKLAVEWTKSFARIDSDVIYLLSAIDENCSSAEEKRERIALVQQHQQIFEECGFHCVSFVGYGSPKEVICAQVERNMIDILAIGSHGSDLCCSSKLGSITRHCVDSAKCIVMVCRSDCPYPKASLRSD